MVARPSSKNSPDPNRHLEAPCVTLGLRARQCDHSDAIACGVVLTASLACRTGWLCPGGNTRPERVRFRASSSSTAARGFVAAHTCCAQSTLRHTCPYGADRNCVPCSAPIPSPGYLDFPAPETGLALTLCYSGISRSIGSMNPCLRPKIVWA